MSWNGFVKAVNRATTTVMQSAGQIEKTVDKDFEDEERRFKNFEAKVEALTKESKGFLDSVRAMTLAQARIAETVDQFYDETAALAAAGRKYKDTVLLMDSNARSQLDNNYRVSIIEPLGKLMGVFPDFNEAIKKRQKKLLDYDRLRANVRKLVDKPSDDPQKLPRVTSFQINE
jgi:amphiphysin